MDRARPGYPFHQDGACSISAKLVDASDGLVHANASLRCAKGFKGTAAAWQLTMCASNILSSIGIATSANGGAG